VRYEVACSWGGTRLVTCDFRTYCTLYCVCMNTSGHNWGAAAELDTRSWSEQSKRSLYMLRTLLHPVATEMLQLEISCIRKSRC